MQRLLAVLMLTAAPLHAATGTWTFDRSINDQANYPCNLISDLIPGGTITRGGIAATFGDAFAFGLDCDDSPYCPACPECACPYQWGMMMQSNIANEPSPGGGLP